MQTKEYLPLLDDSSFTRIKSSIAALESSTDPQKELVLELHNTKAPVILAASLVSLIHNSNVDLHINASGNLSPGATIIAASGIPGCRKATCTTKFQLSDSGLKLGKKNPSLEEKNTMQFLSKFCEDKKSKIKAALIKYGAVYATDAVTLTIIDKVSDFNDKYADKKEAMKEAMKEAKKRGSKTKRNESDNAKPVSSLSEEQHAEVMEKVKNIKTLEEEEGK